MKINIKNPIVILVEGKGDQKFIADFLEEHYDVYLKRERRSESNNNAFKADGVVLFYTNGIGNFKKFAQILQLNSEKGGHNLAIFDADYPDSYQKHGGFQARLTHLQQQANQAGVGVNFYLFPNHKDDGDLEILLENIIFPANKVIFDCWQQYEKAIRQLKNPHNNNEPFTISSRKTKIYAYLECLLPNTVEGKKLVKDPHRNYRNKQHWELHNDKNQYIRALKAFLDKYFG